MPWWDGPQPGGKFAGTLKQVDCIGSQARLVLEGDDRKTIRLLVTDPGKVAINGTGPDHARLRRAEAAPRRHRILPQGQFAPGHGRRGGLHRVPVSPSQDASRFRWFALAVFVLSTAINYLDRQTLATLAPAICAEFHLSDTQYGLILSAFSITYAVSAPMAGMLIDRVGLNLGISLAVGLWSCAGIATGFTRGLGGLVGCRAALGVAEAGGIPGAGKAIHQYLKPGERALGNAVNQAGREPGRNARAGGRHMVVDSLRLAVRVCSHGPAGARLDSGVELDRAPRRGRRACRNRRRGPAPACCGTAACGPSWRPMRSP